MRFDRDPWQRWSGRLYYRFCKPPSWWHNRHFTRQQSISPSGMGGWIACWEGVGQVRARHIEQLPVDGQKCRILASGPSVRQVHQPARLFDTPVACVNGACVLAQESDRTFDYYIVSDANFVRQKPEIFATGVRRARCVILNPKVLFAAIEAVPNLLSELNLYLREDLKRPFKAPRPSWAQLKREREVLTHDRYRIAYSCKPARGTYPGGTVVYDAVQLLLGAGYRRLDIYGMDLTSDRRFYSESQQSPSHLDSAFDGRIVPAFQLVAEYCRQAGCDVRNYSPNSRLPDAIIRKFDPNSDVPAGRQRPSVLPGRGSRLDSRPADRAA